MDDAAWLEGPGRLSLDEGEVHVWRAPLEIPAGVRDTMLQALDSNDRAEIERVTVLAARQQSEASRALLRDILARYVDVPAGDLRFRRGYRGKPELSVPSESGLHFNLSDSGGCLLCGVARGRRIGVDLERVSLKRPMRRLAERFFATGEAEAVRRATDAELAAVFYGLWTQKEAFLKATGEGLSFGLRRFDVTAPEALGVWNVRSVPTRDGYCAAVAVEGMGWELRCWEWNAG